MRRTRSLSAAQICAVLALANLARCHPAPGSNQDHLNLITAQSHRSQTEDKRPLERSVIDHMNLMSSKELSSSPTPEETSTLATDQADWKRTLSDKLALPESLSSDLKRQESGKFDHFDYVVSDLEFELVLKRLRRDVAASEPESNRSAGASDADQEQEQQVATSSDDNFHSSDCFICLEEFMREGEAQQEEEEGDELRSVVRLLCKHEYHRSCIAAWFRAKMASSRRCPVCMNLMRLSDGKLFWSESK